MEQWRKIKGYEKYSISNRGNVFSSKSNKILKQHDNSHGYQQVFFYCSNKSYKPKYIHRLVAEAFLDRDEGLDQVNHKNGIKSDNRLENLEWSNRSLNQIHALKSGLCSNRGSNHSQAMIDEQDARKIKIALLCGISRRELMDIFDVTYDCINNIANSKSWKHVCVLSMSILLFLCFII